jgi:hypothetical protein
MKLVHIFVTHFFKIHSFFLLIHYFKELIFLLPALRFYKLLASELHSQTLQNLIPFVLSFRVIYILPFVEP